MTDDEYREQVKKRWLESEALMGFDNPAPEPEPEKARTSTPEKLPTAPPVVEEETTHEQHEHSSWAEKSHAHPRSVPREIELEESAALEEASEPVTEAREELESREPPTRKKESVEEESGRRHRGRRGRRGGKRAEGPATVGEGEVTAKDEPGEATEEESPERERRGRGRSRPRSAKTAEPETAEQDEPVKEEAADDSDFGDDEPNDLSEWNVPSWQELIASLYRPER
jgi:hypothetical protein